MKRKIYAVYKKDTLLCMGTVDECAAALNVKPSTIYFWSSPANHKRERLGCSLKRKKEYGGVKVAERVEEEDDKEDT